MKTMLAGRYLGPGRIAAEEISIPQISAGEALVEVGPRLVPPLCLQARVVGQ